MWGDIVIAFLLAFITAFVITPHTMRLAKKVGAIDIPNDRRVNKKPMPRLRRISGNCRIFCFHYLSINNYFSRRKNRFIWRRKFIYKINWLFYWNHCTWNCMLYR